MSWRKVPDRLRSAGESVEPVALLGFNREDKQDGGHHAHYSSDGFGNLRPPVRGGDQGRGLFDLGVAGFPLRVPWARPVISEDQVSNNKQRGGGYRSPAKCSGKRPQLN